MGVYSDLGITTAIRAGKYVTKCQAYDLLRHIIKFYVQFKHSL